MRITVSLDTQAVITQPSPLRIKAASSVPLKVAFTRGNQVVRLAEDAALEIGLKIKGKFDAPLLVYRAGFDAVAENLYEAVVNCATVELHNALGIGDGDTGNDKPTLDLSGEIGWSSGSQHFRSQTFPVIAEAPIVPSVPSLVEFPSYPPPSALLTAAGNLSNLADPATARTNLGLGGLLLQTPVPGPVTFETAGTLGQYWFDPATARLWFYVGGQFRYATLISEA